MIGRTCLVAVVALAGCGSSTSSRDVDQEVYDLIVANLPAPKTTTIHDTTCIEQTDRKWTCLVDATVSGTDVKFSGTYECDSANCLWKPDS
jgi:hypothetical protein